MKRSKLITMGISLLAAICLWAYVVTVVNPDGDTIISGIPVTFSGSSIHTSIVFSVEILIGISFFSWCAVAISTVDAPMDSPARMIF